MKKFTQALVFSVSLLAIASCGAAKPSASSTSTPSLVPTSSSSPTAPIDQAATIYFVGDTGTQLRLYSELWEIPADNGESALSVILSGKQPKDPDYVNLWPAGSKLQALTIQGDLAIIDVNFTALNVGAEAESLALEQLSRTVVSLHSDITKVQFIRDGKVVETFAGHVDTSQPIAIDEGYSSLATIDINQNENEQLENPVVITGLACTFEANVPWELSQNGKVIDSGAVTAKEACPVRSPWKVDLGNLDPGTYTFRTWESSMKDGSLINEDTKTFVVK